MNCIACHNGALMKRDDVPFCTEHLETYDKLYGSVEEFIEHNCVCEICGGEDDIQPDFDRGRFIGVVCFDCWDSINILEPNLRNARDYIKKRL